MSETPKPVNTTRRNSSAPTSAAVAERAGVSRTTVSFVLNDVRSMNISEATRRMRQRAAWPAAARARWRC
jgi:AraC-like DNA-binding protein